MAKKNKIFARTGRIFFFKRITLKWSLDLSSKALNAKKEKERSCQNFYTQSACKGNKLYSQGHRRLENTLFKDHFGKSHVETSFSKYKWIKIRENHCLGGFLCSLTQKYSWMSAGKWTLQPGEESLTLPPASTCFSLPIPKTGSSPCAALCPTRHMIAHQTVTDPILLLPCK